MVRRKEIDTILEDLGMGIQMGSALAESLRIVRLCGDFFLTTFPVW
jgi:hypothetical protein